jgi:hypothetical protein
MMKISTHPSMMPPTRSPKSGVVLAAVVVEGATVSIVSVAFTRAAPVTEALVGTEHVGAKEEDEPPEIAQLNRTVPVNPPAGRIVNMSVTDSPAAATDTELVTADNAKLGDADGCCRISGRASVCCTPLETAVIATV